MSEEQYDLMILGTGPAGMTAALYGQRLGLKTIVFGDIPGGSTYMIEHLANFPGFIEGISGTQFGTMTFQQAQKEGAHFTLIRVERLSHNDNGFTGVDVDGKEYKVFYLHNGKGQPLICQHTAGCHNHQWRGLLEELHEIETHSSGQPE